MKEDIIKVKLEQNIFLEIMDIHGSLREKCGNNINKKGEID